jgi:hypothetical protein
LGNQWDEQRDASMSAIPAVAAAAPETPSTQSTFGSGLGTIKNILGKAFAPVGVATRTLGSVNRHMADPLVAFDRPGARWNMRDAYRTEYTNEQRYGAGVGNAIATALPLSALAFWGTKGFAVPGVSGGWVWPARAAAGAALLGATYFAGRNLKEGIQDDGHVGTAASLAGMVGMAAVGQKFGGPLGALAGAAAGGVGGYYLGKNFGHFSEGHLNEHSETRVKTHDGLPGSIVDTVRGGVNDFVEVGPITTGVSFGNTFGMRESYEKDYNRSERGGALIGDLAAATILGAGSLGIMRRGLTGAGAEQATGVLSSVGATGAVGRLGQAIDPGNMLMNGMQLMKDHPLAGPGLAATAGVAAAFELALESKRAEHGENFGLSGKQSMAVAGAAMLGTAVIASRLPIVNAMPAGTRVGASALTGVALVSALSMARLPAQQFMVNAQQAWEIHGDDTSKATIGTAVGVGALGGAAAGLSLGSKFGNEWWKKAAGGALGAVVGGAAGLGLAPTLPSATVTAASAAVGAAALGLASWKLGGHVAGGALTGAVLGAAASVALADNTSEDA